MILEEVGGGMEFSPEEFEADPGIKRASATLPVQIYLNLIRAAERLGDEMRRFHSQHGLTQPQFNVLRILYASEGTGVSCQRISDNLVNRDPDVTGLVDRLVRTGLVVRHRDPSDRRRVLVFLTRAGVELVERVTPAGVARHHKQFADLTAADRRELNRLLKEVLERPFVVPIGDAGGDQQGQRP